MDRRSFIQLLGATAASSVALYEWTDTQIAVAAPGQVKYQATDLTGWELALGDGLFTAPEQSPPTLADIATVHHGSHSELQANTQMRGIMAHNITLKRIIQEDAFSYIHRCGFDFRLPYLPATNSWPNNAQTLEVSIFIWDGTQTRLDYGMAFQWVLNPWMSSFGSIRVWTDNNGGEWHEAGYLEPDTDWHKLKLVIDYQQQTTSLRIDGRPFLSSFAATQKPATWNNQISARLAAEIISLYPGNNAVAPMHVAEFRNWDWLWIPNNRQPTS